MNQGKKEKNVQKGRKLYDCKKKSTLRLACKDVLEDRGGEK